MSSDELIQQEVKLPASIEKNISNPEDFYKTAFEFQQIMMIYESAIKQLQTKLDILNKENKISGRRNPIETVKSRIKSPQSIAGKLQKKQLPITFESMQKNLNDIAGVRVICPYISDIYSVRDTLLKQPDITLLEEKDYIKEPKESGYRSLHLVFQIPVYLSSPAPPTTASSGCRKAKKYSYELLPWISGHVLNTNFTIKQRQMFPIA